MKVLSKSYKAGYCSEYVSYTSKNGEEMLFKISVENGNCYFHLLVKLLTKNNEIDNVVATAADIEGVESIDYIWGDDVRLGEGKRNIEIAKKWIKKVF
jgi:hypothetical protein